jgi:SAM-dependent methyltransferase
MSEANRHDTWASGSDYESYIGRWSRLVAREFLSWLDVPPGRRWLDVGCGTGALSQAILEAAAPAGVQGVDPSAGFIEYARGQVTDERARFEVGDAQSLPFPDAAFDAAVSGLVLNFVPAPATAVVELARVTRPGGTVAVYVWDYAGEIQMLRYFWEATLALDASGELDEGRRFPICRPEPLTAVFQNAGLSAVEVRAIDISTRFRDFDEYWAPFLGGQGAAPGYVASLGETQRAALKERLRAAIPAAPDGSLNLIARAWAVRGTV